MGNHWGYLAQGFQVHPESDEEDGSSLRSDVNQIDSGKIERSAEALQVNNPEVVRSNRTPATFIETPIPLTAPVRGRRDRGNGRFWFKHAFNP